MNARPLTDAQISQALRAHLPEAAAAGLRERVFDAAETTAQLRSFPSFLGALSDADPVGRRRSLLIAAALLVALALASAAAVGALRLLQRDPIDELSLEPPADLPAFVLSSYERLPQLPPVALTWHDSDSAKGRVYVDRSGAVRFDRFTSADATEPSSYTILSGNHRISGMAPVESEAVWVEQGHEAIGDDPRVFLRTILRSPAAGRAARWSAIRVRSATGPRQRAGGTSVSNTSRGAPRTMSRASATSGSTSRPGSSCAPGSRRSMTRVSPSRASSTTEVTEIAFGEQPAALFEPPEGVARMSAEAYSAYICARDLPNETGARHLGLSALRKRRLRRRPSPRPLRCPPSVQTRATARFRRETRASRSVHWPGPRRV